MWQSYTEELDRSLPFVKYEITRESGSDNNQYTSCNIHRVMDAGIDSGEADQ